MAAPEIDPQAMLVFAALAREGGVRGAAAALGVPRSTVSRRLAELERALDAPLVVRTARRFALTELGLVLAQRCEALEALLVETEDLVRRGASEVAGTLRVSAAPVLGEDVLPEVLAALLEAHPRLRVEVRLDVDYADLRAGEVDVALRAWPIDDAADLYATKLGASITGCWAAPSYVAGHGAPESPADLATHECIVVGSATAPSWAFDVKGREQRVAVTGRVRVDSFRVARDLAVRGAGIVRTAKHFTQALVDDGALVPVLAPFWIETPLHAVHAGARTPPPKVRVFVDLVREVVARKPFRAPRATRR
jgi:DNA-binding transcriptional LysR family regulator